MVNQSEAVEYLWKIGWFKDFKSPKEIKDKIENEFEIYSSNIIPILKLRKLKKKIKKFPKGWKQITSSKEKGIKKESSLEEIKSCLGKDFKKEMNELDYVSSTCPNCTAFLMRKILEKLLFIIISKSNKKNNIDKIKASEDRLSNLTELLNIAKLSEINNKHIIPPKNIEKLSGSKFLGDVSAHDYLTSISFEDIQNEISIWRISIKELSSNL
jgi:hypothetical protein